MQTEANYMSLYVTSIGLLQHKSHLSPSHPRRQAAPGGARSGASPRPTSVEGGARGASQASCRRERGLP